MALALYDFNDDIRNWYDAHTNTETGEIEAGEEALADLEQFEVGRDIKIESTALHIKNQRLLLDACNDEIDRLKAKAKTLKGNIDWCSGYLDFALHPSEKCGDGVRYSVYRQDNPWKIADDFDPDTIPEEFRVQPEPEPWRLNKKAAKDALEAGETVGDVRLTRTKRLVVK